MQRISLQQLINELDITKSQCDNLNPLLNEVSMQLEHVTQESFDKESSPFGDKWTPLSQQTLKNKRGSKILTESSLLQSSINSRVNMQSAMKGSVSIGTNLEYAKIHQFGGKAGRSLKVNIPARPFLPFKDGDIPDDLKKDIKEAILNHFKFGR